MKNFRKMIAVIVATVISMSYVANAQVSINTDGTDPDASAMLDVKSTNKGMLIPRIDFNDKPASPATGLLIYVSANGPDGNNAFYYYNGTAWLKLIVADSETDPVFTSWDKTTGITISESQITDLQSYLTTEVDGSITNEIQNLSQVSAINNSVNTQVKNVTDPTDAQDAATKAYVDLLEAQIEEFYIVLGIKLIDIDGNEYNGVTIGTQIWMAENLKVTHYPNGDAIPLVSDNTAWANLGDNNTDDAYCYFENSSANADTYGALYTYAAAIADNWARDNFTNQGICPDGWHLPTDTEWEELVDYLGGVSVAGGKIKETGTSHWNSPNSGATNESGFTALPSGLRDYTNGLFNTLGNKAYFWVSFEDFDGYFRELSFNSASFYNGSWQKSYGRSVRCLKDN